MIEIEVMGLANGPGWTAEVELRGNFGCRFQLWAPREPDGWSDQARTGWAAAWDTFEVDDPSAEHPMILDGTDKGDYRQGRTMSEALTVLDTHPDPDLAARARRLLSGAASDAAWAHNWTGEP
jgi:hypothetical protein